MIAIVDYGLGNVQAFAHVYQRLHIPFQVATKAEDLQQADKLILPGVGAFDHAMTLLEKSGMKEKLHQLVLEEKIPVLGVCVGMQMMAASSEEGKMPGLSWIDGKVMKFKIADKDAVKTRLPHMGWNTVCQTTGALWTDIEEEADFYFLHSYYFHCENTAAAIGSTLFDQQYFTSAVNNNNIYGVQFHPEKSHQNGLQLLKNFAGL